MRNLVLSLTVIALFVAPATSANKSETLTRMQADLGYLASDECEGRGLETEGINKAADYIVNQLKQAGLEPGGVEGTWFQPFTLSRGSRKTEPGQVTLTGPLGQSITLKEERDFQVSGMTGPKELDGVGVVFVGYGLQQSDQKFDEYESVDVKDKVVVILRKIPRAGHKTAPFVPAAEENALSSLVAKASAAINQKAAGIIFVNDRSFSDDGDALMEFNYLARSGFDAGIPVVHIRRRMLDQMLRGTGETTLKDLETQIDRDLEPGSRELTGWKVSLATPVQRLQLEAKNIIGVLEGSGPNKNETVIIGAHYDHLGRGEVGSRARGRGEREKIHYGADDNGSGTASVIELARRFGAEKNRKGRRLVFMLFSGEERGLLGSRHYANEPIFPLENTVAMINLDMVGRLRDQKLEIGGVGTAKTFESLIDKLNKSYGFDLKKTKGGMGPSDHASFYPKKIPVFFFFTGLHEEYHRPSDVPETINYEGMAQIVDMVEELGTEMATGPRPEYVQVSGGVRPTSPGAPSGPKMGILPGNYDEGADDGLLVGGVTEGGPASKAGLKEGDLITAINGKPVTNIYTYMSAMQTAKKGEESTVTILREKKKVEVKVTPE